MKPPKVVRIGPFKWEVVVNQVLLDMCNVSSADEVRGDGRCDYQNTRLLISSKLTPDLTADTVLHEILHAISYSTGLVDLLGGESDERMARMLAPALLDVLRRNPALVRYLTT